MAFCFDRFVVLCLVCLVVTVRWSRVFVFSFCMVIPVKISLTKHSQINTYYSICVTALKINFVSDSLYRVFYCYMSEDTFLLISKASKLVFFFVCVFRKWWDIALPVCISYWAEYPTSSAYLVKGRELGGQLLLKSQFASHIENSSSL